MKYNILIIRDSYIKIFSFALLTAIFSCSGGGGDDSPQQPEQNIPEPATLQFPHSNSECTEGTNITNTESTVEFKWTEGKHADSYNLVIKDLGTGSISTLSTNQTLRSVKLKRGTPYSWYVVSKSNSSTKTANSATWKFYNAGEGVASYAPFPAEAVSPAVGGNVEDGNITLEWAGNDVDNDIASYDIYFGETNPPAEYKKDVTENTLENVPVLEGKTYYWSISTKDKQGNISNSDVFKFKGV